MPVSKTAKRALRASKKKTIVNKIIFSNLEKVMRQAKKDKVPQTIRKAISLADRAAKKKIIHKNKAARIKSSLSKLLAKSKKKAVKK